MQEELVGPTLRDRRKGRGLTQAELGKAIGVTGSAVGQWEQRRTTPSWQQLQKLAEFFEIEVDQPLTPTDDVAKVLDLARTMRVGLETSKSRDQKLDQIIELCTTLTSNQADIVRRLLDNAARIEALLDHFGLEAVPASSVPE